ncbi:hypothetical protein [Synechococcus sp. BA-132 BA5]|uniref:hypothetical protein n=1 Tax=Synechococcus sp. BA-132 BA5 TaxID=3110252 RepID=UPI002B2133F4|nr:hypothetical protein [Synechococcus sp. BA-132 BA5]MEA5416392.1 hypothetical protein [Synechococcus sp. BA-132 BA5]
MQALDEAPPTAEENVRQKKHTVVARTDNAFRWVKQFGVKLAWGTDFPFMPAQNVKQNADILKLVTHDNAQLLALSGPRNPYPGKLGVVQPGALADLILVNGIPLENLGLIADPEQRFLVIMKDGRLYKNTAGTPIPS